MISDDRADRRMFVLAAVFFAAAGTLGQTPTNSPQLTDQQQLECQNTLDPKTFPPETCASILPYLSPAVQLGSVYEDGSFVVFSRAPDGTKTARIYYLPPPLRAEIALTAVTQTMGTIAVADQSQHSDLYSTAWPQASSLWSRLLSAYCYYHPGAQYEDLTDKPQTCASVAQAPDQKAIEDSFSAALTFKANILTILTAQAAAPAHDQPSAQASVAAMSAIQAASSEVTVHASQPAANPQCAKTISFAVAFGGSVYPAVPGFAEKWTSKNNNKFSGVCFSQSPNPGSANYLFVFANSSSAFQGIYPTVRTSTSTNVTPVSGSGIVTNNYGGMWSYTYNGTVTTTTTTSQQVDLPYIDQSNILFISCYRQDGTSCGVGWRTVTTRSGGDPYNTLGYNLGSALASIHMKQNLLRDAVKRVVAAP